MILKPRSHRQLALPRVSVVIPVSTRADLLPACLRALATEASQDTPFEVIVVLSGESHGFATELAAVAPPILSLGVVSSPVNLGLAGAAHAGRTVARGEFLVFLHDDTEVQPGWLAALVAAAERHPEAGAIGSQVLSFDGGLQSAGSILWRDGTTCPPWVGDPPPAERFARGRAVDYCGTSSLLVRTATWDALGGFDQRFYPVYFVDVDFAMAVRRWGGVVRYEPASRVFHHKSASTPDEAFRVFVSERNRRIFCEKWSVALEDHEARARDLSPAIARALVRTEARGESLRASRALPQGPATIGPAISLRKLERRSRVLDRALSKDYAAHVRALSGASPN
ncbi:MAG: glycosyltransferase family 2 protein [Acidobacteriota bacterium]